MKLIVRGNRTYQTLYSKLEFAGFEMALDKKYRGLNIARTGGEYSDKVSELSIYPEVHFADDQATIYFRS